jgi:glycosyltransferase involved in cell wall biosynthesis
MGKRGRKGNKRVTDKAKTKVDKQPFVSVCTPTYNRRPFIPYIIRCFEQQDYPRDKMEWIIVDDGTDSIEDLVRHLPYVKYHRVEGDKLNLGAKRNMMHKFVTGDIVVYMDDDDFYPKDRVSHAVKILTGNKKALCAGSSEIYIYFPHLKKTFQFGPYGPNHATAGTFAFKKKLLEDSSYDDDASLAEEKAFLKNYTVPFVQLDPLKAILVVSHTHNTFDKKKLLKQKGNKFVKDTDYTPHDFIKDKSLFDFYINGIEDHIKDYEPGRPSMKPDVIEETERRAIEREEQSEKIMKEGELKANRMRILANRGINITQFYPNGSKRVIPAIDAIGMLTKMEQEINELKSNQVMMSDNNGENSRALSTAEVLKLLSEQQKQIKQLTDHNSTLLSNRDSIINEFNSMKSAYEARIQELTGTITNVDTNIDTCTNINAITNTDIDNITTECATNADTNTY